jgi:tRNA pseudouridine55 synthase
MGQCWNHTPAILQICNLKPTICNVVMDGLLVIDKPAGPTSHEVVARVRRVLGERRVGHTGTLDPAATGVLPLVVGRATRLARFLSASDKSYEAIVRLGVATDTDDALGTPVGLHGQRPQGRWPSREAIEHALDAFRGTHLQQPPAFSAKKVDGKRSYKLARAHARTTAPSATSAPSALVAPPAPAPVLVTARAIDIVSVEGDRVTIRLECSAGFYVRALAHELGERLGIGAHLATLRRTRSGGLTLSEAVGLDAVDRDPDLALRALVPLSRMLLHLPAVTLTIDGVRRAVHGRELGPGDVVDDVPGVHEVRAAIRLLDGDGQLVGIAEASRTPGFLHPAVVLV